MKKRITAKEDNYEFLTFSYTISSLPSIWEELDYLDSLKVLSDTDYQKQQSLAKIGQLLMENTSSTIVVYEDTFLIKE